MDLAERFGDEFDDGTFIIPIALSRQELANLISTTFETTVRVMSKFKRNQIIDTTAEGFVIRDFSRLRTAASSVLACEINQKLFREYLLDHSDLVAARYR